MSSTQRQEQSRKNGAKSIGPKTREGLQRSSQNSLKHGLTAKAVVLPNESQAEFNQLRLDYIRRFQPQDTVEMDLVEDMVVARWRLRRLTAMQTAAFRLQLESSESEFNERCQETDDEARNLLALGKLTSLHGERSALLLRYETTNGRAYDRAMKALERLQKNRPVLEEPEIHKQSPETPQPEDQNCETIPSPRHEKPSTPVHTTQPRPYLLE